MQWESCIERQGSEQGDSEAIRLELQLDRKFPLHYWFMLEANHVHIDSGDSVFSYSFLSRFFRALPFLYTVGSRCQWTVV